MSDAELDCGITSAAFHPDGVILGTGCNDTMVRVWEVRQQKVRPRFRAQVSSGDVDVDDEKNSS